MFDQPTTTSYYSLNQPITQSINILPLILQPINQATNNSPIQQITQPINNLLI